MGERRAVICYVCTALSSVVLCYLVFRLDIIRIAGEGLSFRLRRVSGATLRSLNTTIGEAAEVDVELSPYATFLCNGSRCNL